MTADDSAMTHRDRLSAPGLVGQTLNGRYRLLSELGRGGMGIVYAAEHLRLGRRVAVKMLSSELAADEHWKRRFKREAQLLDELRSRAIVDVLDFDETPDGVQFLVMELLAGADLKRILAKEGPLPLGRAAAIILQACTGVGKAHRIGVTHRDLKPKNLFICTAEDGTDLVKILDFGVARRPAGSDSASSTRAGSIMGTFRYMPPEQIRGAEDLGPAADVYSLGAILYEMLAGKVPFAAEESHVLMHQILYETPAPIESFRPELPDTVVALVKRALSRNPEDRFASADDFAAELRAAVGSSSRAQGFVLDDSDHTARTLVSEPPEGARTVGDGRGPFGLFLFGAFVLCTLVAFATGRWSATQTGVAATADSAPAAAARRDVHLVPATTTALGGHNAVVPIPATEGLDNQGSGSPMASDSSRFTLPSATKGHAKTIKTIPGATSPEATAKPAASALGFDTQNPYDEQRSPPPR